MPSYGEVRDAWHAKETLRSIYDSSSKSETDRDLRSLLRLLFLAMTLCGVVVGLARRTHCATLWANRLKVIF